ncbi:MAG: L,D-transpeptidase family protein [Verrucomicrobiales bacterium]|nr:L,D-transpeptidase family protein [Verrucomicrobiales bacterium]
MKSVFARLAALTAVAGALLLSSCVTTGLTGQTQYLQPGSFGQQQVGPPPDAVSFWDGGAGNGAPRLHINLAAQVVDFYRGNVLVGRSRISSGDTSHPSPTGRMSVLEKNKNHVSSRYGDFVFPDGTVARANVDARTDRPPAGARFKGSPMPNFMRITWDGVGMHAGFLPGYPASHGCIRMPDRMSEIFFSNVQVGTPVLVTN